MKYKIHMIRRVGQPDRPPKYFNAPKSLEVRPLMKIARKVAGGGNWGAVSSCGRDAMIRVNLGHFGSGRWGMEVNKKGKPVSKVML